MRRLALITMLFAGCDTPPAATEARVGACPYSEPGTLSHRERCLFDAVVHPYLQDDLWRERDAGDATRHLMIPLHRAYALGEGHWQRRFAEHFAAFTEEIEEGASDLATDRLARVQYLYLASQFALLATRHDKPNHVPLRLVPFLYEELDRIWFDAPGPGGDLAPPLSMKEQVEWKLDATDTDPSHQRAILEEEHYVFALAADLVAISHLRGLPAPVAAASALDVADKAYLQEAPEEPEGGWLFQRGVWDDHPDWEYAGTQTKPPAGPAPVDDAAPTTAQAQGLALWLRSLEGAHPRGTQQALRYRALLTGLEAQLWNEALVEPSGATPYWRTANYFDGGNGVFRWDSPDAADEGYGAYELSGELSLGWWSGLSVRTQRMYADMAARFPLEDEEIALYRGLPPASPRHPTLKRPTAYVNGMMEFIARVAAIEPRPAPDAPVDAWQAP